MPLPQVGNWKPYKSGSGKRPPDPEPLGRGPVAGYGNPRFPTIGPKDVAPPAGGYQSSIDTSNPIDPAKQARLQKVATPYASYGGGAGKQSRSAFARALTDTSSNAMNRAQDTYSTDYRRQAEKSRSEDILAQRQSATDRYRMDVFKDIFDVDTSNRYTQGIKDGAQMYETEKANEEAKRTAIMLRFLGGLI